MQIYLTDLHEYNNGNLVGEWVELPFKKDLKEILKEVLANKNNEFFITDYEELPFSIGEFEYLPSLNEKAELYSELDEMQREIVKIIIDQTGNDFFEVVEKVKDHDFRVYDQCETMGDVAYQILEENGQLEEDSIFTRYFDFEAYGRDLDIQGQFYYSNKLNGFIEIWG